MDSSRRVIWIVDDSASDAERAAQALSADYAVRLFADGSSALEALGNSPLPDLFVLDWVMPSVSGIDVCRFLRSSNQRSVSNISVLLLTARNKTEQIVEGLGAGANDFLTKPYSGEELRARVAALMRAKRLLERAEAAEQRVERLLAGSPDPLISLDPNHRITYVNSEAERLIGRPCDDITGRYIGEIFPPTALDQMKWSDETPHARLPDIQFGDRVLAPSVRVPLVKGQGEIILALRDVTEQRRMEARRLDFYSIVAHDLRSPLAAITLRADLMLRGRRGLLSPELIEDVRRIQVNSKGLVALINDFLDLARLEAGVYRMDREVVDLGEILEKTMQDLYPLAEAKRLRVRAETPSDRAYVEGDPRRLGQVFSNLLGNAIKFTKDEGTIVARIVAASDYIEAAIEDTGVGIHPDVLPRVFDRYARADSVRDTVSGTGLGLTIVREIVQAHDGSTGVESRLGSGSRFWFRLPSYKARPTSHSSARQATG
jgi:two-component system phosphate regulon sensor histidine kinase PhoR